MKNKTNSSENGILTSFFSQIRPSNQTDISFLYTDCIQTLEEILRDAGC